MKDRRKLQYLMFLMPVLYGFLAYGMAMLVENSGVYPSGKDALGYLYQGDVLYQAIQDGDYWPLFEPNWYNGVEMMRYQPPVPIYMLAACQCLAGGNSMRGFLIFVGLLYFLGAVLWFLAGIWVKRPCLGAFLGGLWFFMPNNLFTLFYEGDLPRAVCNAVLPFLVYFVYDFLKSRRWHTLPKMSFCVALIFLCHPGYGGMMLTALFCYFVVDGILYHQWRRDMQAIFALVLGIFLTGAWLLPSLAGGIVTAEHSELMADFFQNMFLSVDPAARMHRGNMDYYFGLAAMLLAVFGIFLSKKKSMPGFWTGLLILLCSSETCYLLFSLVPGGKYMQMLRLISVGLCMVLFSFLIWDTLKRGWILLFAGLLVLDALPSFSLILGNQSGSKPEGRMEYYSEAALVGEAKEMTSQRMAFVDESSLGAMSAYLVAGYQKPVAAAYGAAEWTAATTANLKQIDRALEEGNYLYVFDRCKELGNDTVIIRLDLIKDLRQAPILAMDQAASRAGYRLMDSNDEYRFYKLDVEGSWGTITKYRAIGIGSGAQDFARQFPVVEEVETTNLNDFAFEDLKGYDLVYLAGFTYDDKAAAEKLITDLSQAGVHIVIAADGIPDDRGSRNQSFLGAVCNEITFSQGYPELDTIDGKLETDLFPDGYREWNTVYLDGLEDVWGTVKDEGWELPFYGTVKNDNIVMIGLNLTYYYGLTWDQGIGKLLSHAMDLSSGELPKREVVPYQVQYDSDCIVIDAGKDDVNTGLAWHDSFSGSQEIYGKNHLAYVKAGQTVISLTHPYRKRGIAVSGAALFVLLAYSLHIKGQKAGKEGE